MRDCLIVVGMHRSGTSALAGAIHRLGVAVGTDVVAAQEDNVRGYYEHRQVLDLHEQLLAATGSSWDDVAPRDWAATSDLPAVAEFQQGLGRLLSDEFTQAPLWAVKDPRLCHLLPLWRLVLRRLEVTPRVLFAYRPAHEVASSLARRNGFSARKSNRLWVDHVLAAERATRDCPRSFIAFGDLLRDPVSNLDRAATQLGIDWPQSPAASAVSLRDFLDAKLTHSPEGEKAPTDEVVAELEAALEAAARSEAQTTTFDALAARVQDAPAPDALLVEHVHQFSRRETRTKIWAAKQSLEQQTSGVSQRLGEGLEKLQEAVATLKTDRGLLADQLASHVSLGDEHRATIDRTAKQLAESLNALDEGTRHQAEEIADLARRLDRLQHDVEIEATLETLRRDLDFLAGEYRATDQRLRNALARPTAWERAKARLIFWRPAPSLDDRG